MSKHVRVVFDRRKRVEATGKGNVEIIIQLSRLAVKKIIVDSMTLFCATSARNTEISAVIEDVSIIPLLFCNKSIVDTVGGKRQEKFYYLCQKLDEDTICCRFVIFTPINRNLCIGHNLIQERNQSTE